MAKHSRHAQVFRRLCGSPRGSVDPSESMAPRPLLVPSCLEQLRHSVQHADGQDIVEYALLAVLIALVVSGVVLAFGDTLGNWWTAISAEVQSALASG